jgi:D-3-phosphoglycerate dehydrogenase
MVAMTVDQAIPQHVMDEIVAAIGARWGRTVDLDSP